MCSSDLCNSCKKEVVDFTNFSDKRLIDYLENRNTNICGKINNHQLNRNLTPPSTYHLPQFSRLYKFLASILFASLISRVEGQETIPKEPIEQQETYIETTTLKRYFEYTTIKGRIFDESTNEPVPFVKISLTEDSLRFGCMSDIDGYFELKIKSDALTDTSSITLRSPEYLDKRVYLNKSNIDELHMLRIEEKIVIQPDERIYQTIGIVIIEKPRKTKRRIRKELRNSRK